MSPTGWRRVAFLAGVALLVPMAGRAQRLPPETPIEAGSNLKMRDYYDIERVPVPEGVVLEVGAMARGPGDSVSLVTRRGDLYRVDGLFAADLSGMRFHRVASGLQEPLGVTVRDGRWWVVQRSEVTEIEDRDGDGTADAFRTVSDRWGLTADPHEYAFASQPDAEGNLWVTLTLTDSVRSSAYLRGWAVKVTPDGTTVPVSAGLRSPGGVGFNREGVPFYTESQGYWVGSSALRPLLPGSYQGAPPALRWWTAPGFPGFGTRPPDFLKGERLESARARMPSLVPPAVIFPHGDLGQCPTGFVVAPDGGRFGPFDGQLCVGELAFSQVQRAFLERVNGVWLGAAFPFLGGFGSGPVALLASPEGYLLVGETNRGWGSRGQAPFALEKVRWTGRLPFEILEMRVKPDGFHLRFTAPVLRSAVADPASYALRAWTYNHSAAYGSPKVGLVTLRVREAVPDADECGVRLRVEGQVRGHVHELRCEGVLDADGKPLLHPVAYYTLNEVPAGE